MLCWRPRILHRTHRKRRDVCATRGGARKEKCLRNGLERRQFWAFGILSRRPKRLCTRNQAGALHTGDNEMYVTGRPGSQNGNPCAGINRHEVENARVSRARGSDPLGPEFCAGHREVHAEA